MVSCLETGSPSDIDRADVKLVDGVSMVHTLKLDRSIKTFHDYAEKKVLPFIKRHLTTAMSSGTGISQKAMTRESRGAGVRQRLLSDGNGKIPKNWNGYLRNATNKIDTYQE